jgi:hypothetical protein
MRINYITCWASLVTTQIDGVFSYATRKVIYLGGFIDRGSKQKQVLDTVMDMANHGSSAAGFQYQKWSSRAREQFISGCRI